MAHSPRQEGANPAPGSRHEKYFSRGWQLRRASESPTRRASEPGCDTSRPRCRRCRSWSKRARGRRKPALSWLDIGFAIAKFARAKGVVIVAQADMWDPEKGGPERERRQSDLFRPVFMGARDPVATGQTLKTTPVPEPSQHAADAMRDGVSCGSPARVEACGPSGARATSRASSPGAPASAVVCRPVPGRQSRRVAPC